MTNNPANAVRKMVFQAAMSPPIPPGFVRIGAPWTAEVLTLLLDETPPTPSGDIGGWESIVVPRRRAVRYWKATPEAGLDLAVILERDDKRPDDKRTGDMRTVAEQIKVLTSIGSGVEDGDAPRRPRRVELKGQLPPLPVNRWVINDVTWGDAIYDGLELVRQHLTIKLGEPPDDNAVKVGKGGRSKFRTAKGKKSKPTAKLLAGETLQQFSARVLGNPSRWREIAGLQKPKIKDPRSPGKAGRVLKLPKS